MASRKLTNTNKVSLLQDWAQNATNRGDFLYFITEQLNPRELEEQAFNRGLLIRIDQVDGLVSKITFVDLLS